MRTFIASVQAGILQALPKIKTKTYYAPEIFDVAYEELHG